MLTGAGKAVAGPDPRTPIGPSDIRIGGMPRRSTPQLLNPVASPPSMATFSSRVIFRRRSSMRSSTEGVAALSAGVWEMPLGVIMVERRNPRRREVNFMVGS